MSGLKSVTIKGREMKFPTYFPDATRGVVRSLDSDDLKTVGIEGLVVNTYHLITTPGTSVIKEFGGIKQFMGWDGFITTDSGGWQIFSMLQKNNALGLVSDDGVKFFVGSKGNKKKYIFTPEISINAQFNLNPDIVVCLDAFTPPNATREENEQSVMRTVEWAKRCKEEFIKQCEIRHLLKEQSPLLLVPIQGGFDRSLREKCAVELLKIGFGAFGLGGWLIGDDGKMNMALTKFIADLVPRDKVLFALGAGLPMDIVNSYKVGWHIFDCVLPTRDARHGRLFIFNKDPEKADLLNDPDIFGHLYIDKEKFTSDKDPISPYCDCPTCQNYSKGYLRHLFAVEDSLAFRLASLHNLRTYSKTIELLRRI